MVFQVDALWICIYRIENWDIAAIQTETIKTILDERVLLIFIATEESSRKINKITGF